MKHILFLFFLFIASRCSAQQAENIILITTDGLRWQEVFKGMDSAIANNKRFNESDSTSIFKKYWSADEAERRKKLLPFFWSTLSQHGQLHGNRFYENRVDNANPYRFSYPGYSELVTGYADTAINSNAYPPNPHVTVLEFLARQPTFKGKVATFGAWEAFNRILNEKRSGIPVIAAYDASGGKTPTPAQKLINAMLADSYRPWHADECFDVFTHYAAMEYLRTQKPRVLYIAYGETDEWAHSGKYRSYLDAAHQVDAWIKDIWEFVQSHPQYKNKTALLIATDHGRGDVVKGEWTSHGQAINGAQEIWLAAMGPSIVAKGEIKEAAQLFQKQIAQTIARLLGYHYKAAHPVAPAIDAIVK